MRIGAATIFLFGNQRQAGFFPGRDATLKCVQIGKFRLAENTAGLARAHTVFIVNNDGLFFVFGEFANLARQTFQGNIFGVEKMPVFKLLVVSNIQKQRIGVVLQAHRLRDRKRAARRGGPLEFGE